MLHGIENYIDIVGYDKIADIHRKASKIYNKHLLHLNSTFVGGGVAEIISRIVPMKNDIGVDTGWRILHGNHAFFEVTKKFHNAIQGDSDINISEAELKTYLEVNEEFSTYTHIDHDCVIIHDPQPLPLVRFFRKRQPWIWRCHIDIADPKPELWKFLKSYMLRYDVVIISSESYRKDDLPVEQRIIPPAIDPLNMKNMDLSEEMVAKYIEEAGIPTDKPIVTQVSRMDPWKDPEGVLDVYMKVREKVDCRLLFCYNLAADDPEGVHIYSRVYEKAKDLVEKGDVLFVIGNNDILVNAIQRFSSVILQKSIKEGFGLTVAEALWKGTPVVASNVGGIPMQIRDGRDGFLVEPNDIDGCADRVVELLKNKTLCEQFGITAKEMIKEKFLITRLLGDYLDLINDIL
jgi:trehalose synthase